MTVAVDFENLRVQYGESVVIDSLDLKLREGEFTCFLGPSGCGKSTMLRMIGELSMPAGGKIEVLGRSPDQAWEELSYVFQAARLVPWRTALGNVILGLQLRGIPGSKKKHTDRAREAMRVVGIEHLADRPAHVLSGGEQQRVSIARAVAMQPRILLLDEPFAALDVQTRHQLREEISALWQRTGLTIIFVTHDVEEALIIGSRVVVFSPKPTVLLANIAIDLPKPVQVDTREFEIIRTDIIRLFGSDTEAIGELTNAKGGADAS